MLAYYLLLGIPLLLELITTFNASNSLNAITVEQRIKSERKIIVVFFVILFLLLAFRSKDIGVDLDTYEYFFYRVKNLKWGSVWGASPESFFSILNKIISYIGGDFQFFLAVVAFITVVPFAVFYYKECENALLTISIFINVSIFTMFFSGLRQTIAFSIGIIVFYCVKKKKKLAFLLWVLVAYLFHNSAFLLLILYPIYHIKLTKKSFKLIVPIMVVVFIFKKQVFNFLLDFLSDDYLDKYGKYQETGAYTIFILFVLFTIYSFVGIEDEHLDKNTMGLRNILVVATCFQMFVSLHNVAMRMNYYFIPFIPVVISKITASSNKEERNIVRIINSVLIVFFLVYFFYTAYTGEDILEVFPYKTFWSE